MTEKNEILASATTKYGQNTLEQEFEAFNKPVSTNKMK
jgi:hypothetical protein